jgi:rhamnulokinase
MAHLAVDLGASGGKLYVGAVADGSFTVEQVARFDNRPVERAGRYVWDLEAIHEAVRAGVRTAITRYDIETVAVDTWGVDFGLLADGEPVEAPYAYRDPSLESTVDAITETVGRYELFERTGINHWNIPNTLWQYHYLASERPDVLSRADRLVMMPQLVATLLGADPCGEPTIASTSQMLDPRTREWDRGLLERLGLPTDLLPTLADPGTTVGSLAGHRQDVDIVLPASHDTAGAVAALPLSDGASAFLSTGTWFIVGLELEEPLLTREAFELGASNELGAGGTVRLVSNVNGFFLLEEAREAWASEGGRPDYGALVDAARSASTDALVNPDDPLFGIEGSMPDRIRTYCRSTGQPVPDTRGEVVRVIVESLAAKVAVTLADLLRAAGESVDRLHVGGGGVRNELFCRRLASAVDRPVRAGPADATAVGNVLVQAIAAGGLEDLAAGRGLVAEAMSLSTYEPGANGPGAGVEGGPASDRARERMRQLCAETVGDRETG